MGGKLPLDATTATSPRNANRGPRATFSVVGRAKTQLPTHCHQPSK